MRRRARTDAGQSAIAAALRAIGASVQSLAEVGDGCPDLLVGLAGRNVLLEVKEPLGPDGGTSRNGQRLTPRQVEWHVSWRGRVVVVRTIREALEALGVRAGAAIDHDHGAQPGPGRDRRS